MFTPRSGCSDPGGVEQAGQGRERGLASWILTLPLWQSWLCGHVAWAVTKGPQLRRVLHLI